MSIHKCRGLNPSQKSIDPTLITTIIWYYDIFHFRVKVLVKEIGNNITRIIPDDKNKSDRIGSIVLLQARCKFLQAILPIFYSKIL